MKITILGGSGPTGIHLVNQALAAGHEVTALVRTPAKLERTDRNLTVVRGDATDVDDLKGAFADADAVLTALGSGNDRKSTIASQAAAALVPAAQATGVRRVVIMSAFGVGGSRRLAGGLQRTVIKLMMDTLFADKAKADDLVRASDLDWTLVYPTTLGNGPGTGTWKAAEAPKISLSSKIDRADVAAFMLDQLTSTEWLRRTAVVTS